MSEAAAAPRIVSGLGQPSRTGKTAARAPALPLDRRTYVRSQDCVHCGLCLPVCPTYTQNGLEADSPRGRIILMKGLADGRIGATPSVLGHLDLCLDCRACETACPSGVVYHELIEETRTRLGIQSPPGLSGRLTRAMFRGVFPYPRRLKLALLGPRLLQRLKLWAPLTGLAVKLGLPPTLAKMRDMLPRHGPLWEKKLEPHYSPAPTLSGPLSPRERMSASSTTGEGAASGTRSSNIGTSLPTESVTPLSPAKATVGFFAGCIGSVLYQDVNRQAIALLQMAGCEVIVPQQQVCCGAMHHHGGLPAPAQDMARRNIDAFLPLAAPADPLSLPRERDGVRVLPSSAATSNTAQPGAASATPPGVDFIATDIAGCGAMLKDYPHLLRDDPLYAARAAEFSDKVRDISELLVQLRLPRPRHALEMTVTYHDACHLAHAQRVTEAPRQLLKSIPSLTVVPLPESDMCCGAAGTYNLSQPAMARDLAERKVRWIQQTGAEVCVAGNVGCAMQIQSEADRLGVKLEVVHPVTLLHRAYFG